MATTAPTSAQRDVSPHLAAPTPVPPVGQGTGIALLTPGAPLPPPWRIDPSRPACDLCRRSSDELWPLASKPGDDIPAGELIICRACADSVRPVHHTAIADTVATSVLAARASATCS